MAEYQNEKQPRQVFSNMGLALCVFLIVATVTQVLWFALPNLLPGLGWLGQQKWWIWLGIGVPLYVIALPVSMLVFRTVPVLKPEKQPFSTGKFLLFIPVTIFIMYTGNIIGTVLSMLLSGGAAENPLTELAMENSFWKILVMVILAPLMEEFVFRKLLIDRTLRYGEKTAVLLSAITFGLFHQNLFQFFYAFGVGLLLAYLYVRSGKLRYPVILHMIVNFMGSVVASAVLTLVDQDKLLAMETLPPAEMTEAMMEVLPQLMLMLLYFMLLFALYIAGLVILILFARKLTWKETTHQLDPTKRFKTVYLNVGMILFVVLCLFMCVISLLP